MPQCSREKMFSNEAHMNGRPCRIQSFGDKNPDKYFYVIFRKASGGFFSNLFHVLGHIKIAEDFGFIPVVDMENFPVFYNEDGEIHGTTNSWEYYFDQTCAYQLPEIYKSKKVIFCCGEYQFDIHGHDTFLQIYSKYIKPKKHITDDVEKYRTEHFGNQSVLGIHFRGQEMNTTPDHPIGPTVDQVLRTTEHMLTTHAIDKIFVVTEDHGYLDALVNAFGEKAIFKNSFRTYGNNAYKIRPYPRHNHMYLLGRDILQEALLLSSCDYLLASGVNGLASGSNVSQFAQMVNNKRYKHVETIFNGASPPSLKKRYPFLYRCYRAAQLIFNGRDL